MRHWPEHEDCTQCRGYGWYCDWSHLPGGVSQDPLMQDYQERYCACPAGDKLREWDGALPKKKEE